SAQTALELLEHRAREAQANRRPWPEFAEYDCFACHHDLQAKSWRQARNSSGPKPGTLPWHSFFLLNRALDEPGDRLEELRHALQKPLPDPKRVVLQAREVLQQIKGKDKELEKAPRLKPEDLIKRMRLIAGRDRETIAG